MSLFKDILFLYFRHMLNSYLGWNMLNERIHSIHWFKHLFHASGHSVMILVGHTCRTCLRSCKHLWFWKAV